jgi:hypothetical protein
MKSVPTEPYTKLHTLSTLQMIERRKIGRKYKIYILKILFVLIH